MIVFDILILFLAVIVNFLLLGLVYVRNPKSATNRLFALLALVMSLWSIANYYSYEIQSEQLSLWLVRSVMFFAVPLSVVFFLLMHTFPRSSMSLSRKATLIWTGLTLLTMAITVSPLLFSAVELTPDLPPKPTAGPGMILFIPIAIGAIPLGLYYLFKKTLRAKGREKTQFKFLLVGVLLMYALIFPLIFIAVNIFNTTRFIPYSALFTLPFTILTAYAIVRHRLMDIRAAVARSLSFTALIGGVLLIYGALAVFVVPIIVDITGINSNIAAVAVALISIPIAKYIQKILSRMTDRFLFQDKINYRAELVKTSQELSGTIQIKDVINTIINTTDKVIRVRKTVIFLKKSDSTTFSPIGSHGIKEIKINIPENHHLIEYIKKSQQLIVKDELTLTKEQATSDKYKEDLEQVEQSLIWLDATVVLPLFVNKELSGIILLGNKKSGDQFLQEEIEFLSSFAPQAATALQNAQLYKESLEFGRKLELEVHRATSELAVANDQLRDLDKAKSEFLSIASHQLYTPLTAIRGYLSMLKEKDYGELSEKQKPIIDILESSSNKLIGLIRNLLDISRIESGRLELNLESASLSVLVDELVIDLMPNAIHKELDLNVIKSKKPLSKVVVDKQRIRQVILNFVDNAIKYTKKGKIDVTLKQEGQEIVFSVVDTGDGITREGIAKLFNKFTRVGGDARFKTEGTGLGLYVAKQIVKEHHGEIEVTSPGLGEGSTFAIRLPIEGSPNSLKVGDKVEVDIKAAKAEGKDG